MKLWLLRPTKQGLKTNWDPWYDKRFGFVIRASTAKRARKIADSTAGDENRGDFLNRVTSPEKHPWLNPEYSICTELTAEGDEEVIIDDFRSA